jgi:hypothetical protein
VVSLIPLSFPLVVDSCVLQPPISTLGETASTLQVFLKGLVVRACWCAIRYEPWVCPCANNGLPTTILTGNSFMGQRIVEKLHLMGTGLVRVIQPFLVSPHHLSHSIHGLSWKTPPLSIVMQHIFNFY